MLKPVARAYVWLTPSIVQRGVDNFFANLSDLSTAANDVLQGKPKMAATHLGRFAINSLGVFDPASSMDTPTQKEDFGQTLGVWGVASGPYLVLPIFWPSTVRDTAAPPVEFVPDPVMYVDANSWRYGFTTLRLVECRASVLELEKTFDAVALPPPVRPRYLPVAPAQPDVPWQRTEGARRRRPGRCSLTRTASVPPRPNQLPCRSRSHPAVVLVCQLGAELAHCVAEVGVGRGGSGKLDHGTMFEVRCGEFNAHP